MEADMGGKTEEESALNSKHAIPNEEAKAGRGVIG
jgi:hypothetical protein